MDGAPCNQSGISPDSDTIGSSGITTSSTGFSEASDDSLISSTIPSSSAGIGFTGATVGVSCNQSGIESDDEGVSFENTSSFPNGEFSSLSQSGVASPVLALGETGVTMSPIGETGVLSQ